MPTTGHIGQLALMQMKSGSRLAAANGGVATSQAIPSSAYVASPSGYGTSESSIMKQSHRS